MEPTDWTVTVYFKSGEGSPSLFADVKQAFVRDNILHIFFNDNSQYLYNFDFVKGWTARPHYKERNVNE